MTEHLGLHWISSGRIFGVPLDAQIPACMILQSHRLDDTVSRVRRRSEPGSERGDALVVGAGNGGPAPDDLTQRGRLVDLKIMNSVPVVADSVVHVLDEVASQRNVNNLSAPADRQQRQVVAERGARHRKIKCVLLLIHSVLGRVRLLAGPPGRDISTAGKQYTIREPDPLPSGVDVDHEVRRVRVHNHRLSPGRENGLDEGSGGHLGRKTEGCRIRREAGRDGDQCATGDRGLLSHI
jgi:hypothetical protein